MGSMIGMFLFAFQVFSTLKCRAVIFSKFESACVHARPLRYLDAPYYIEHVHHACVHTMCMLGMISQGLQIKQAMLS